jgi:rfaE bifunctional protein kinase chain/domain/rfaE bifunctional protein nucleotidyltransferase chain/domain
MTGYDPHASSGIGWAELHTKIVDLPALATAVQQARHGGKTVVHCHGCFDIVHPGHIRYLQFARRQGDVLVVSLTGDAQIDKGPTRPYIPQELRAENLAALQLVDYVYINPHPTAAELIAAIRPDVYVKGHEYQNSTDSGFVRERQAVEACGGRVIFSSGEVVFSSTKLLERLSQSQQLEYERLATLCTRHGITAAALAELLDRIHNMRVLVIGDTIVDRYVFCDAQDLASESPMMCLTELGQQSYLGGAAIVAQHIAAMGGSSALVTGAAHDEASERLAETLEQAGIEHRLIRARPALVQKTRFLVDETKIFKLDQGHPHPLDSQAERAAAQAILHLADGAGAVIWCDFGYGTITEGLWSRTAGEVRRRASIVAADVSGARGRLLRFTHADLLCPTERELRSAMHDFESGLSSVAWECLQRTQARQLLVTLDKRGVVSFARPSEDPASAGWRDRLRSEHLPALGEHAVDRLGCGDAFLAAATLALVAGASLAQAAYLGGAAAAIELTSLGNVPVDAGGLRDWLDRREELLEAARPNRPQRLPPAKSPTVPVS